MNNKIRTTLLGGLLSASIASPVIAGDFASPIQKVASTASGLNLPTLSLPGVGSGALSFTAGYHSTYVWRGVDFGDEMADWSLEAAASVGEFDLTFGIWGANVFEEQGGSEVDVYVNASKDLGFATLDVGYILYYFHDAPVDNTQEFYVGLSKEVAGVGLSATYYYDFDNNDSSYLELGAEKSVALGGFGDLDTSLVLGINPEDAEFTHIQGTIAKSFDLNSEVSFTPYISYSHALISVDSNGVARGNEFIAGGSIGFSF